MESQIDAFYSIDFFRSFRGLPEAIIQKEKDTGKRIPSGSLTLSACQYQRESTEMWLGQVGEWFFFAFPSQENDRYHYEVFESLVMAQWFFSSRAEGLPSEVKAYWLRELREWENRKWEGFL